MGDVLNATVETLKPKLRTGFSRLKYDGLAGSYTTQPQPKQERATKR